MPTRIVRLLVPAASAACLLAAAASLSGAGAQTAPGSAEQEARACLDRLIEEVPTYRALRELRERADANGFRVTTRRRENYNFNGRPVFIYGVQVNGEAEAYRLACVG